MRVSSTDALPEPVALEALRRLPVAVAIVTEEDLPAACRIVFVNEAWIALSGYTEEQLVGHSALLLAGARPTVDHARRLLVPGERGEVRSGTVRHQRPDGSTFDAAYEVTPVRVAGSPRHRMIVQREVSAAASGWHRKVAG